MLVAEMLAHFCQADHGSMYVITQSVGVASQTDWLRTLTQVRVKDAQTIAVVLGVLNEIDAARNERNTIVHGTWRAHTEPGHAMVQTFNWSRAEVARDELWDLQELDAVIEHIQRLQLMLGNLGLKMGFLKT